MKHILTGLALCALLLPLYANAQTTERTRTPRILNIQIETTVGSSKRVIWDTDKPTVGYVDIYEQTRFAKRFISPGEPRTHHEVSINGLKERFTYQAVVKVRDPALSGPEGFTKSNTLTLKTERGTDDGVPTVVTSTVRVYFKTATTAYITWQTAEETRGQIRYGIVKGLTDHTTTYPNSRSSSEGLSKVHDAVLTGLKPFNTYHFKIKATNKDGNAAWSSNFSFGTLDNKNLERNQKDPDLEALTISNFQPLTQDSPNIGPYTVTTTWKTNRPTIATITYKATGGRTYSIKTTAPKKLEHEAVLTNLDPDTTYTITIKATDGANKKTELTGIAVTTANGPPRVNKEQTKKTTTTAKTTTQKKAQTQLYTASDGLYQAHDSEDVWTIMLGQRFKLAGNDSLESYGYGTETITRLNKEDLAHFPAARYAKKPKDKKVYLLNQDLGIKTWIPNETAFRSYTGANFNNVITVDEDDLNDLVDASLVRIEGASYLYSIDKDGKKHLLKRGEISAQSQGLDTSKIMTVSRVHLSAYPSGSIIP